MNPSHPSPLEEVAIDVGSLFRGEAKLRQLPAYEARALKLCGNGNAVLLTGRGPVWLYLRLAHALHGKASRLAYWSPASGRVAIFNHDPN